MRSAPRNFAESLDALHHQRSLRQAPEILRQLLVHRIEIALRRLEILGAARIRVRQVELLVRPHELEEGLLVALKTSRRADLVHLAVNALHFRQAEFVDLVRRHLRGRLQLKRNVVPLRPLRQRQRANLARRRIRHVRIQPRDQPLVSRPHLVLERRFRRRLPGRRLPVIRAVGRQQETDLGIDILPQRRSRTGAKRRAGDDVLRLSRGPLIAELRRTNPIRHRELRPLRELVDRRPQQGDTRDIRIDVRRRFHLVIGDQEIRQVRVRAAIGVNVGMPLPRSAQLRTIKLRLPDRPRCLRIIIQLRRINRRLHPGHAFAPPLQLL